MKKYNKWYYVRNRNIINNSSKVYNDKFIKMDVETKRYIKIASRRPKFLLAKIAKENNNLLLKNVLALTQEEWQYIFSLILKYNNYSIIYIDKSRIGDVDLDLVNDSILLTNDEQYEELSAVVIEKTIETKNDRITFKNIWYKKASYAISLVLLIVFGVSFNLAIKSNNGYVQALLNDDMLNKTYLTSKQIKSENLSSVSEFENYRIYSTILHSSLSTFKFEVSDYVRIYDNGELRTIKAQDDTLYTNSLFNGLLIGNNLFNHFFMNEYDIYNLDTKELFDNPIVYNSDPIYNYEKFNVVNDGTSSLLGTISINTNTYKKIGRFMFDEMKISLNGEPVKVVNLANKYADFKNVIKNSDFELKDEYGKDPEGIIGIIYNTQFFISDTSKYNYEKISNFCFSLDDKEIVINPSKYNYIPLYYVTSIFDVNQADDVPCIYVPDSIYKQLFDYFDYGTYMLNQNICGYRINQESDFDNLNADDEFRKLVNIDETVIQKQNNSYNTMITIARVALVLSGLAYLVNIFEVSKYYYNNKQIMYNANIGIPIAVRTFTLLVILGIALLLTVLI